MPAAAGQKELATAIERRSFDPAYLFVGDDDFRKHEALARLLEAAVDPATRDFNLEVRRGSEVSAETLGSILATPPMLADRRTIVVRDAGNLRKDAKAAIESYLARPAQDVMLVLILGAEDRADAAFARATPVAFDALDDHQLSKWIAGRAQKVLGTTITPGAVTLLHSSIGNDLGLLSVELEKLATYAQGKPIDEAAVGDIVGVRPEDSMPALLDAIGSRDATAALRILPGVLDQPKASAVVVAMALGFQVLGTAFAAARLERRVPAARIEGELFTMMREGGAMVGRPWGDAVKAWVRHAPRWSSDDLARATLAVHEADLALKDTHRTTDEGILQTAILAMCTSYVRTAA